MFEVLVPGNFQETLFYSPAVDSGVPGPTRGLHRRGEASRRDEGLSLG